MSYCVTGICPHGEEVFIWLGGGPWLGDKGDPDCGRYPWVHNTTVGPGHLKVCDRLPFATPAEAGEACADCGHSAGPDGHEWPHGKYTGEYPSPVACSCGCPRWMQPTSPPGTGAIARLTTGESRMIQQLACGEPAGDPAVLISQPSK